ncbi:MAG: SIMPL domain-containing protein [Oscillospiraceae bacterium]
MEKTIRTINVTGEAKMTVPPDCVKIPMTFEDTLKTYDECLETCSSILNSLKTGLKSLNFNDDDIKTVDFRISPKYEHNKGIISGEKRTLKGYSYYNNLYIKFRFEPQKVSKVLELISSLKTKPIFTVQYTILDYTKVKNELLKKAVETSKNNAQVIALGLGSTLGKAINVDYHWSENSVPSQTFLPRMKNRYFMGVTDEDEYDKNTKSSYGLLKSNEDTSTISIADITPEDIILKDTINVVWEIL